MERATHLEWSLLTAGALTGAESYSASSRRALKDVDVSYTTGDVTVDPAGVFVSGTTKDDTPYDVDVTKDPGAVGVFVG